MKRRLLILVFVLASGCALREEIGSACSDPLRLYTELAYETCCVGHDTAYRVGGTEADRLRADQALYTCVRDRGYPKDADSMFVAVRAFGASRFHYTKGSQ